MKLLSLTRSSKTEAHWLVLPDGRALKYELSTLRLTDSYIYQHAFAVAHDRIGFPHDNPDYAYLDYCPPPLIKSESFKSSCILHAKQQVLLGNLVQPEYAADFLDAFTEMLHS